MSAGIIMQGCNFAGCNTMKTTEKARGYCKFNYYVISIPLFRILQAPFVRYLSTAQYHHLVLNFLQCDLAWVQINIPCFHP